MKTSRSSIILLAVALVALVLVLPVRMLASGAMQRLDDAQSVKNETSQINARVQAGRAAKAKEAELNTALAKIRETLPNVPEQFLSPVIRVIGDKAAAHNVTVTTQTQESPIPAPTAPASAAPSEGAADQAAPGAPKAFTVSLAVKGAKNDVIAFLAEFPSTQRLFVDGVSLAAEKTEDGYTAAGNEAVKANIVVKAYVANPVATGS